MTNSLSFFRDHARGLPISLGAIMAKNDNYQSAARWWLIAANSGLPEARYNLARLYQDGIGVEKDIYEARFWYKKAAQTALSKYDLLSAQLKQSG